MADRNLELEYRVLRNALFALILLLSLKALAYFTFFRNTGFLAQYGWWMLYADIAVVSIAAAVWHLKAYRSQVTMMQGMMIGMTFGMQTGLMIGTILAVTNGLFIGGLVGMLVAVTIGILTGKCCGLMGMMEGAMAGVMGGLMGSMIGTMFRVDHILWLMPFFFIINVAIIAGLSMILAEHAGKTKPSFSWLPFFLCCLLASAAFIALMRYGPKTGLAALGV